MMITKEVTMNLNYRGVPIVMDALQGDTGRALVIHLLAGDAVWTIPQDAGILMQYQCEDGTGGVFDTLEDGTAAYSVLENHLTVHLAPQLCAVAGCTKLQVTIFSGDMQISTFCIEIRVAPQVNAKTAVGDYFNLSQWLHKFGQKGDPGPAGPQGPKGDTGEVRFEALTPEQKLSLKGDRGEKGDTGNSGVYIGTEEPTDPAIGVWINPEGDGIPVYAGEVL